VSFRAKTAAPLVAIALLAGGCSGLSSDDEVPKRVSGPEVVTKEQIDSLPAGSPARTLFGWWQALQFDDSAEAVGYYAGDVGMTRAKLDGMLVAGPAPLGLESRPKLVEVHQNGDDASVLVLLESVAKQPNGREDTRQVATSFNMVREDGEWKLADNRYLTRIVGRSLQFLQQNRRQEREQDGGQPSP
jgi:hypothetical protein